MRHLAMLTVGFAAIGSAAAFAQNAPSVVATVNGVQITSAELDGAFRQSRVSDRAAELKPADVAKLKMRVLQILINRSLLNQHLAELKVNVDERLVADHVKQVEQRLASNGQTLAGFLQKLGVTEEQMRSDIRNDYRWVAYVESQAKESVLRKYFEANKAAFDGSTVRVKHILFRAPEWAPADVRDLARRKAEDARGKLVDGTKFESLAKAVSECPSARVGGELPEFPRKGVMAEAFAAAAFELKEGVLSSVVETEFGFHVMVVAEHKKGKPVAFEEKTDEVKNHYAEDLRRSITDTLRKKAKIEVKFELPPG